MTAKLNQIHNAMRREGWDKYTNDPSDSGGPTKWGIKESTAREHGYKAAMQEMPQATAERIYSTLYWDSMQLDMIEHIDVTLAVYMFDYGVNSGVDRAARTLQRLLNVLNDNQQLYDDIEVDGHIGQHTLSALQSFISHRHDEGLEILRDAYNSLRKAFLIGLSENRENQERFTYGWLKRVVFLTADE